MDRGSLLTTLTAALALLSACAGSTPDDRIRATIDGTIRDGVYTDWSRTFSIDVPHRDPAVLATMRIGEDAAPGRVSVSFGPAGEALDIFRAEVSRLGDERHALADSEFMAQACIDDITARLEAGLGVPPMLTSTNRLVFGDHPAFSWTLLQDAGPVLYTYRVWMVDFGDALGVVTVQAPRPGSGPAPGSLTPETFARSLTMLARAADGIRDDEFTPAAELPEPRPQVPKDQSTPAYPDKPPSR